MIIGIDLGTTNSLACAWMNDKAVLIPNEFGKFLTPSVVSIEKGTIIVGDIAKQRLVTHPNQTIASFKRFMGLKKTIQLENEYYSPQELSSFIIRKLVKDAELYLHEKVDEVIVSVPAYFNNKQRYATKQAGELAGVTIERIINEPTAAALANSIEFEQEHLVMVVDFGGGTLDISIVDIFENIVEIIAISGNNHLGGDDFNKALRNMFLDENKMEFTQLSKENRAILLEQVEKIKFDISEELQEYEIAIEQNTYKLCMNEEKLIHACSFLFQKIRTPIMEALKSSTLNMDEIDDVIMVGGSSKMRSVQKYISYIMSKQPIVDLHSDQIIAIGCGVAAGIKMRNIGIKDLVLTDVCPFSMGVGIHNPGDIKNPLFSDIIPKNSALPTSKEASYCTVHDFQQEIKLEIFQGENLYANENHLIGSLTCKVPESEKGKEFIKVRFSYDINGILEVDAEVISNHVKYHKIIVEEGCELSEKELTQKIKKLSVLKYHPREDERNKLILARGEKLFIKCHGEQKEIIKNAIYHFESMLASQESIKIRRAAKKVGNFFDVLEGIGSSHSANLNDSWDSFLESLNDDEEEQDDERYLN